MVDGCPDDGIDLMLGLSPAFTYRNGHTRPFSHYHCAGISNASYRRYKS